MTVDIVTQSDLLKEKNDLILKLDSASSDDYNSFLSRILDIDLELNLFMNKN